MSWTLIVLALALIVTVASVIGIAGLGATIGSDNDPTSIPIAGGADATDEPVATGALSPTESPAETEVVEPTLEPTRPADPVRTATPLPTAPPATAAPTETNEPGDPTPTPTSDTPAGGEFNTPFPGRAIPAAWGQGSLIRFGRDDFVDGGAYRRTDGVLYGRPAAHLYSRETEFSATTVTFNVLETPDNYIGIRIVGMDDEWAAHVDCRLSLNEHVVWEGASPFGDEEWTDIGWRAGNLTWLREGENTITFEIMAPTGEFGRPPWILLNEMTVYFG